MKSDVFSAYRRQEALAYNHNNQICLLNRRNIQVHQVASENALPSPFSTAGTCKMWDCIFLSIYPKIRMSDDQTSVKDVINVFLKVYSENPTKWYNAHFPEQQQFGKKETI